MATTIDRDAPYRLDRHVVYKVYNEDDELVYVGVAVANIEHIFVQLKLKKVRGLILQPRCLNRAEEKLKYKIVHIMSDTLNTQDDALEMAQRIASVKKPKIEITKNISAVYMMIELASV